MTKTPIFGLALAIQLVKSADIGDVPQEEARGWYKHFGVFEWISQDDLAGDALDDAPPIDAISIGQMLCRMVRMGWMDEVRNFLALGPCPSPGAADTPDYYFSFWSTIVRDRASNPTGWSEVHDVLRNLLLASICNYMLFHVEPEPRQYDRF